MQKNRHMKWLNITNHQGNTTKTTIRYHLTPVKMAVTKYQTTNFGKDVEKREPLYTVGGNVNWYTTMKTVWRILKKLKIGLQYDPEIPLLGIYLKKTKTLI